MSGRGRVVGLKELGYPLEAPELSLKEEVRLGKEEILRRALFRSPTLQKGPDLARVVTSGAPLHEVIEESDRLEVGDVTEDIRNVGPVLIEGVLPRAPRSWA